MNTNTPYSYQLVANQRTHDGYILSAAAREVAEIFGAPALVYTRAQAIADGMLVDVSATASEAGFRVPVALTRAAWADCVRWDDRDSDAQAFRFQLYRIPRGGKGLRPRLVDLVCHIGPGDNGEPVSTITLPGED